MKTQITSILIAGLVSAQTLFEEPNALQEAVANNFDRELQNISADDDDDDILNELDTDLDLDGLDDLDELDELEEDPSESETKSRSRKSRSDSPRERSSSGSRGKKADRWGKKKRWDRRKEMGKKMDRWNKGRWGKKDQPTARRVYDFSKASCKNLGMKLYDCMRENDQAAKGQCLKSHRARQDVCRSGPGKTGPWGRSDRRDKKRNKWGKKRNQWGKKKNQWGKRKNKNQWRKNKKRGGRKGQRPDAATMEKMKRMGETMKDLGKCAPIVKRTMMDCFFVTSKRVRDAMTDERSTVQGANALTPKVNADIGKATGECYEKGLNLMAICMQKEEAANAEKSRAESDSESDSPREKEEVMEEAILDFSDDLN